MKNSKAPNNAVVLVRIVVRCFPLDAIRSRPRLGKNAIDINAVAPTAINANKKPSIPQVARTLGSIKYLAEAGAHSATFYETVGWNGVMDADDVSARPAGYPSQPGKLFPV